MAKALSMGRERANRYGVSQGAVIEKLLPPTVAAELIVHDAI